jgi:RimJ/RimL family protein N-acetyltransferase
MIVKAAPWLHFPWIVSRAGVSPSENFKAIEALDRDGRIHGMVGYDAFTDNSCVMSIALDNPAAFRALIRPCFEYPFLQLGKGVALCTIRGSNAKSIKLTSHVGFREAYRIRDGISVGEDMLIYEMRREECRWIPQLQRKVA